MKRKLVIKGLVGVIFCLLLNNSAVADITSPILLQDTTVSRVQREKRQEGKSDKSTLEEINSGKPTKTSDPSVIDPGESIGKAIGTIKKVPKAKGQVKPLRIPDVKVKPPIKIKTPIKVKPPKVKTNLLIKMKL